MMRPPSACGSLIASVLFLASGVIPAAAQEAPKGGALAGIDVLVRDRFAPLKGRRIGLITNHTGRTRDGVATVDVLAKAEGVKLVSLFSPEHGIRGDVDAHVPDGRDEKTNLPIFSLYGKSKEPRPESLEGLDALVFDIQDIGARFYTYISTLGITLEIAGKRKLDYFVLDRPNPINGVDVEGPLTDPGRESFTAFHRLPVRHGLTVGELARLLNAERSFGANLTVIRVEGWQRKDFFDATGLVWVNPSPNMRSLTEALLYPGIGLLETTNVSVGRGTDTPFEVIGAPWLDSRRLASALNGAKIPGARFVPIEVTPASSTHKGARCEGVNIVVTDRSAFQPVRTGLEIACALRALHPKDWNVKDYGRLLCSKSVLDAVTAGRKPADIEALYQRDLEEFRTRRKQFLLYE